MTRLICIFSLIVSLAFVAGCTRKPARDPQIVANPDKVSLMLADAADKAADALQTLAAVEQARSPAVQVDPIVGAPQELRRAVTVSWVGPVEPIVKRLADRASYNFVSLGNTPSIPLVINIDAENMPVIDVLRDIGLQLGRRADLSVDGARRIVEIHYAPVESGTPLDTGIGG